MSYFLTANALAVGQELELAGDEARHIVLARRLRPGEQFSLQDQVGQRFLVEALAADRRGLKVRVLSALTVPAESKLQIHVYQALTKEKQLDYVLQKCTELGVQAITIFNARYTPERLPRSAVGKAERWQRICQEAAKQSDRRTAPAVRFASNLDDVVAFLEDEETICLLDANGDQGFAQLAKAQPVLEEMALLIGPEGGWAEDELARLTQLPNLQKVGLGSRVLRAETAATAAVAVAQALWGDLRPLAKGQGEDLD